MGVPVGQRNVPDTPATERCYAVDACHALCLHVLKITANVKYFDFEHHADIVQHIRELAVTIYNCAYVANVQNVTKDPATWEVRKANQEAVVQGLNEMVAMVQVAKPLFHLRSRKTTYWLGLTLHAKDLSCAWHASDVRRYGVPVNHDIERV